MPTGHYISFTDSDVADTPQIKFGGQPDWVDTPTWPLSRETGKPMRFIGQVDLSKIDGYAGQPAWAYLFMTDDPEEHIDGTWEPDSGENCLLLQPGNVCPVETTAASEGPTIDSVHGVELEPREDAEFVPEDELFELEDEAHDAFKEALSGNKIGGTPSFLQSDEFPDNSESPGDWLLVLQLDSSEVPFEVNFGDLGIGYAFVRKDGSDGRFLWQCG